MIYRIRYNTQDSASQAEAAVEANSPTEAIVKFRHMRSTRNPRAPRMEDITSVSPDPLGDPTSWHDI